MRPLGTVFFSVVCSLSTLPLMGALSPVVEAAKLVDVELLVTSLKEVARFKRLARRLEQALAAPSTTKQEAKMKYWLFKRLRKEANSRAKEMGERARSRDAVKMMVEFQRACVQEQKKVPYKPWLTTGRKVALGFGIGIPALILLSGGVGLWHKRRLRGKEEVRRQEEADQRLAQELSQEPGEGQPQRDAVIAHLTYLMENPEDVPLEDRPFLYSDIGALTLTVTPATGTYTQGAWSDEATAIADLKNKPNDGCLICQDSFADLNRELLVLVQTDCNHIFCRGCLDGWFATDNTCPTCRKECEKDKCKLLTIRQGALALSQPAIAAEQAV